MEDLVKRIDQLKIKYETLKKEIARKIVGQEEIIDKILVAIFSNGHCLLIGVPGLAKTLMVTAISGLRQNPVGENHWARITDGVFQDSVYAGFDAFRYYRY